MGYSVRHYLVEGKSIKKIPNKKFDRITARTESLIEYCGKALKYVQVILEQYNRIPERIISMKGFILYLDNRGYMDEKRWNEQTRLAMDRASGWMSSLEPKGNVIEASHRFAEKKYRNDFMWELDTDTVDTITGMIWGC